MDTLNTGFHSEKLAFLGVACVLQLFCTKITLSVNTYGSSEIDGNIIVVNSLGIRVGETWRSVPDARLRGNALESDIPVLSGYKQPDDGLNGTTAVCEGKLKVDVKKHLPQLVKTCIVSSFIEGNLHPHLSTMVPAIIMDTEKAMVVLYCYKHDLLLVSNPFKWRDSYKFNVTGIAFLWAMINHR